MSFLPDKTKDFEILCPTGYLKQRVKRFPAVPKLSVVIDCLKEFYPDVCKQRFIVCFFDQDHQEITQFENENKFEEYCHGVKNGYVRLYLKVLEEVNKDVETKDVLRNEIIKQLGKDLSDIQFDRALQMFHQATSSYCPHHLESNTYDIWYPSIQKFVKSYLQHKYERADLDDRAVFASSFTIGGKNSEKMKMYDEYFDKDPILTLGPVNGFTTDRETRMLLGFDQRSFVQVSLVPENQQRQNIKTVDVKTTGPFAVASVKNLIPSTRYIAILNGIEKTKRQCEVKTQSKHAGPIKIGLVAKGGSDEIWKKLSLAEGLNFIFHTGGQINGQLVHDECCKLLENQFSSPTEVPLETRDQIRNRYQSAYLEAWNKSNPIQYALSHNSNLMQWDINDVGTSESPFAKYVQDQGRYVFWMFQRSLREDPFQHYISELFGKHEGFGVEIQGAYAYFFDPLRPLEPQESQVLTNIASHERIVLLNSQGFNLSSDFIHKLIQNAGTKDIIFVSEYSNQSTSSDIILNGEKVWTVIGNTYGDNDQLSFEPRNDFNGIFEI